MCAKSDDRQYTGSHINDNSLLHMCWFNIYWFNFISQITWADPEGGEGMGVFHTLENLKLHYVSVEILVRTPSRSNWTPWWSSVEPSVKYADYFLKKKSFWDTLPLISFLDPRMNQCVNPSTSILMSFHRS